MIHSADPQPTPALSHPGTEPSLPFSCSTPGTPRDAPQHWGCCPLPGPTGCRLPAPSSPKQGGSSCIRCCRGHRAVRTKAKSDLFRSLPCCMLTAHLSLHTLTSLLMVESLCIILWMWESRLAPEEHLARAAA